MCLKMIINFVTFGLLLALGVILATDAGPLNSTESSVKHFSVSHHRGKKDLWKFRGIDKKKFQQFLKKLRKHVSKPKKKAIKKQLKKGGRDQKDTPDGLPDSFDWRQYSDCRSLKDIRDQYCGNCWASSAAAILSDRHCLIIGQERFFSEAQITKCADRDSGCSGGNSDKAFAYYSQSGIASGGDESAAEPKGCLPKSYLDRNSDCPLKCTDGNDLDSVNGTDADYLTDITVLGISMDERIEKIKREIYEYGPVVVYIQAYLDFDSYTGGVYIHDPTVTCGGDDRENCFHAIRVIGWGTDNGVPYWLCANQWGTSWGDQNDPGMIKVKQGVTDQSGVDWFATWAYPVVV